MKTFIACCLILCSMNAFSERMVLTGRPVNMTLHQDFFTFPSDYRKAHSEIDYHFVMIHGTKRVCFLSEIPQYASLDMIQIFIEELGVKMRWNCYQYNPDFFEMDY